MKCVFENKLPGEEYCAAFGDCNELTLFESHFILFVPISEAVV